MSENFTQRKAASQQRMAAYTRSMSGHELHSKFANWVLARHQDGSEMLLTYAFRVIDPDDDGFAWVFSEHNGYHLFCREDLDLLRELTGTNGDDPR